MWSGLVKIQYTELKLSCGNDPVVKNYIYSNADLDLWPNDPKIKGFFSFHRGIMWPSLVKIRYTDLKLLCGNLCGRLPARHTQSHNTDRLETGVKKWGRDGSTGGCHWKSRVWRVRSRWKFSFFVSVTFFSRKLQKRSLTCMTRGPSPNTLHTMVHV